MRCQKWPHWDLAFVTLVVMAGRPEGAMLKMGGPQTSKEHGALGVCPLGFLYMISKSLNLWFRIRACNYACNVKFGGGLIAVTQGLANNPTVPDSFLPSWNEYWSIKSWNMKSHFNVTQKELLVTSPFPFLQSIVYQPAGKKKTVVSQHILDSKMFADKVYLP